MIDTKLATGQRVQWIRHPGYGRRGRIRGYGVFVSGMGYYCVQWDGDDKDTSGVSPLDIEPTGFETDTQS
jgi:hypothetical protein